MGIQQEEQFIHAQIQEICRYLKLREEEKSNVTIIHWIEQYAAEYRKHWEEEHRV